MKSLNTYFVSALLIFALPALIWAFDGYHWRNNQSIDLDTQAGHITRQSDVREGSASFTIDIENVSGEAIITADNSVTAQLHNGASTLVTEYKLTFDGDGSDKTGGADTAYSSYNSFLSPGTIIKYVPGDYEVQVTLWVKASNISDNVADSGTYSATQTLTVTWNN